MAVLHPYIMWLPLLAFAVSCLATFWLSRELARAGQLDYPGGRSSHVQPVPRGGGLAIGSVFVFFSALLGAQPFVLVLLSFLIAVFWLDDKSGLWWQLRILAQCFAIGLALALLWQEGALQQLQMLLQLPLAVFVIAAGFVWLWYVNHFNFSDGIDGLMATQAVSIAFAAAIYFFAVSGNSDLGFWALTLGACTLGFFVWNYPPARIFLGDVGSVPLGFATGYLLVVLAGSGGWGMALSLPLWLWCDTTVTLVKRVLQGKSPLEAHREHFYQRAAGTDSAGHRKVTNLFMALQALQMLFLAAMVYFSPSWQWPLPVVSSCLGIFYFSVLRAWAGKRRSGGRFG